MRAAAALPPALGFELPARWTPLDYHPVQAAWWATRPDFSILLKGRQSGGTELVKRGGVVEAMGRAYLLALQAGGHGLSDAELRQQIRGTVELLLPGRPPDSITRADVQALLLEDYTVKFCAPTRDHAKDLYWESIKALVPPALMRGEPSESELKVKLRHGPRLQVVGMDKPARAEGGRNDLVVLDEFADMKPEVLPATVMPAVSTRGRLGKVWLVGKSKLGKKHYKAVCDAALAKPGKPWRLFTWPSTDIWTPEAVERARGSMSPLEFACEVMVQWVAAEGRAYYTFDRAVHTRWKLRPLYAPRAPLLIGLDFNVEPGVATVAQDIRVPDEWRAEEPKLDEVVTGWIGQVHIPKASNTPAVCRKLIADWGKHQGEVRVYGDVTGGSRHTSQTQGSDWDLVRAHLGPVFGDRLRLVLAHVNPPERDRVNAMCCRFRTADERIHALVDPDACLALIDDLEAVQLLKGGSGELDKKSDPGVTHWTDAMGYQEHVRFGVTGAPKWAEHPL